MGTETMTRKYRVEVSGKHGGVEQYAIVTTENGEEIELGGQTFGYKDLAYDICELMNDAVQTERQRTLSVLAENRKAFRNEASREMIVDKIRNGDER